MIVQKYNYSSLDREMINGSRHYCLPDGSRVASVTTILDKTKPIESVQALQRWRKAVGESRAQQITTESANRGTRMHSYLEQYIKGGIENLDPTNPYAKQSLRMAQKVITEAFPNIGEVWGCEVPLYYSGLYAGTTDCLGLWKGNPAILDFKQSNKIKKREWIEDYFLQLAAYAAAHNETHGTKINTGVILMCTQDEHYLEFELLGDEFQFYTNKWWDRVEKYYKNH